MANTPHISLTAETLAHFGPLPITNSLLTTWILMSLICVSVFILFKKLCYTPSRPQAAIELIISSLDNLFTSALGQVQARRVFALIATIFIFVILSNWSGLIPGVGSIFYSSATHPAVTMSEKSDSLDHNSSSKIPLFRAPTADLNTTLALALVSMGSIQFLGIRTLGSSYLKKFFNFASPVMFFVGILELTSEFSRLISFTFRLFGNIFAGEVLLTVISFLAPIIAPIPFLGPELFVGFIQALVFSMLTVTFLSMAISHENH